jgi:hypothetical protein
MKKKGIRNLIVITDTHCGDTFSICPLNTKLWADHGKRYKPTDLQQWLWKCWKYATSEWLSEVTRDEPFSVLHNGDMVEGSGHHGSIHMATMNTAFQQKWCVDLLRPLIEKSKKTGGKFFSIRGTEAHEGIDGIHAENVARELKAVELEGMHSHLQWNINLAGKRIRAQHHISGTGIFTGQDRALRVELSEALIDSALWNVDAPDCLVAGHVHRQSEIRINSKRGYIISLTCPSWQLKTPYGARILAGRQTRPQVGMYLIRVDPTTNDLYTRHIVWALTEQKVVEA